MYKVITMDQFMAIEALADDYVKTVRGCRQQKKQKARMIIEEVTRNHIAIDDPKAGDVVLYTTVVNLGTKKYPDTFHDLDSQVVNKYHMTKKSIVLDWGDGWHQVINIDRIIALIREDD